MKAAQNQRERIIKVKIKVIKIPANHQMLDQREVLWIEQDQSNQRESRR
jgi:hypothetical protein